MRKINPYRRFNRQHPFDIWRALSRLQVMDKLQGIEERYFFPREIAAVLYVNWNDLSESLQDLVIRVKLHFSLACLEHTCFIEEEWEMIENPNRWDREYQPLVRENLGKFKARNNVFRSIQGFTKEQVDEATYSAIDDKWAWWIGRRGATFNG